jgi:hypothetical protein
MQSPSNSGDITKNKLGDDFVIDERPAAVTIRHAWGLADEVGINPIEVVLSVRKMLVEEVAGRALAGFSRGRPGSRENPEESSSSSSESPYLDVEQAARYLKKTPKAIYGLLERGRLKKMPGSHVCYFTKNLLDEFLRGETTNGRSMRPGRRKKN